MKKNKSLENRSIKKQHYSFILYNMLAFLIVYFCLGFFVIQAMNHLFFVDLNNELETCMEINKKEVAIRERKIIAQIANPRIMVIFYDENKEVINGAYSDEIFKYLVKDYNFGDSRFNETKILEAKQDNIFILSNHLYEVIKFEKTNIDEEQFDFMTLSFDIDSEKAPNIKYCKLLVMVNGEVNTRNKVVSIYIIASFFIISFGMIASIILSSRAIKPISDSLQKQLIFVGDASHELRTPLSIVQSKLENILTKTDATVLDVSEDIAISLKEVSRLNKLTNDLLVLARSDNDNSNLDIKECDIKNLVSSTSEIFKEMANISEKEFSLDLAEVKAYIDRNKFTQLLIILLDNALKYTNTGDTIKVKLFTQSNDFVIEINDTGIGVSDETKKKIFERFYREDKARSRETGGNGLGLAIARTIVLEHGGKISCEHNQPKGTRFIVCIPLKEKKKNNNI